MFYQTEFCLQKVYYADQAGLCAWLLILIFAFHIFIFLMQLRNYGHNYKAICHLYSMIIHRIRHWNKGSLGSFVQFIWIIHNQISISSTVMWPLFLYLHLSSWYALFLFFFPAFLLVSSLSLFLLSLSLLSLTSSTYSSFLLHHFSFSLLFFISFVLSFSSAFSMALLFFPCFLDFPFLSSLFPFLLIQG